MTFHAAHAVQTPPDARFVFCSRHGEFERTLSLLRSVAAREPASPAEFSLSVHNALAGLLSIAWTNRAGHASIAAGHDSFGCGLLEAVSCLAAQPHEPVLLVYFDDALPDVYAELRDSEDQGVAVALLLTPARGDMDDVVLSFTAASNSGKPRAASRQALDFLAFLLSGANQGDSHGGRMLWRWRRAG